MGRRSGAQNLKSQEPPFELRPSSSASAPSAARRIGGWSLPALSGFPVVLRSVFAAFQTPPLPHHGRKRAVFVLAALLLLTAGNARAQGTPDLVVLGPDVRDSIETGATFWLLVTVTNQGDGRSAATTVRYYRSTDSTITTADTLESTDAVRALVRPQGYGATIQLTAPSTADTYYYGACVDAVAGELDTTNNCSVSVAANVVDPPGGGGGGGPRTSAPGAPRNLTAEAGDGQAVLSWDAPASDGGAEITDYEYRINGTNPWISIGSTETTYTVTGLVNGAEYTFQVRAVNAAGRSASSNRDEATPEVFTLDFAHFANGDGLTSDLVFVNVGTHPIRPALYFYDQEGQPMAAESVVDITGDLEIQEDGSLSIQTAMEPLGELTISTHGQGKLVSGSVKVAANGPIGGVLRFDLPEIGVAGVGASPPVRDAVFPVRRREGSTPELRSTTWNRVRKSCGAN